MNEPAAAAAPARANRGSRNRAIDVLRGWAIVFMICNHVGVASHVTTLVNLPVWLDPAGPFVLLAGLVLGMGLRGDKPLGSVWRRARQLWLIHIGCMLVVLAVHETTGRLLAPSIASAGGFAAVAWKLPTLRLQALDFMNILPLFVVFTALAPLLIRAMRRGFTTLCVLASAALWLFAQHDREWFRFTDPVCGPEAFVLPAWQFAFVIGLSVGFHANALPALFLRHRHWFVPVVAVFTGVVFGVAQLQRNVVARLGALLPESIVWIFDKASWAPGRALYTLCFFGLAYLGVDWLLKRGRLEGVGWLETMGRKSLYCFLVHLPFALLSSGLYLNAQPGLVQDVAAASSVLAVYLMARYEVLGRYIPS